MSTNQASPPDIKTQIPAIADYLANGIENDTVDDSRAYLTNEYGMSEDTAFSLLSAWWALTAIQRMVLCQSSDNLELWILNRIMAQAN